MIIKRQKEFSKKKAIEAAKKAAKNAKLVEETLGFRPSLKSVSRYTAQPTNPSNDIAIARFIKKHGREPSLGELNELRLRRYNGRYWPEEANGAGARESKTYQEAKKLMKQGK